MFANFKENLKKTLLSLFVLSFGILIFVSLISFNQSDNTLFKYDSSLIENKNTLGLIGSIASDLLLEVFGNSSYFLGIFFVFHSFRIFFSRILNWYCWGFLPISMIILCFGTEFLTMNFGLSDLSGGVLGLGLLNYFNYFFENLEYEKSILLIVE